MDESDEMEPVITAVLKTVAKYSADFGPSELAFAAMTAAAVIIEQQPGQDFRSAYAAMRDMAGRLAEGERSLN